MGIYPLFSWASDLDFVEQANTEVYRLYYQPIKVWKLSYTTSTVDRLYHEDINMDISDSPSYVVQGYIDVSDNGLATLRKAGQEIAVERFAYFSRKLIEDTLSELGFDPLADVPTGGDVLEIQGVLWEVIAVDPVGFHMNDRMYPTDLQAFIRPWRRDAIARDRFRRR